MRKEKKRTLLAGVKKIESATVFMDINQRSKPMNFVNFYSM